MNVEQAVRSIKLHTLARRTLTFIKKHTVLSTALLLAVTTSCIVVPDAKYAEYFDFKTLTCLFCTLAVVCALKNLGFFTVAARKIVQHTGNARTTVTALVYITFFGSMILANDMALITFLPLSCYALSSANKEKYMAFTFIMQNISANLGGMLTPFGNPQNLYLYSKFNISTGEFFSVMLAPFAVSAFLIAICCLFVKPEPITLSKCGAVNLDKKRTALCVAAFIYSIIIVFRIAPFWTGLIVIPAALIFIDKNALKEVDYALLSTFAAFFVFAGNMARIDVVREFLSSLLEKNTLIVSALSCQIISNVPSSVLLSQFTADYTGLLIGVNIGGVGTLISSLASLITLGEYMKYNRENLKKYLYMFSAINFGFLFILLTVCSLLR